MNIEMNDIVVKIEDGEFTFNNLGLNGFFDITELRDNKDIKGCVKIMFDNLIGIKNVAFKGKDVSLEEFKALTLERGLFIRVFIEYESAIEGNVVDGSGYKVEEAEKNAELPTG
jgi:hypothetical protein